jgi:predicted metal-binding protein
VIDFEDMLSFASKIAPNLKGKMIKPSNLIFEEKVKMSCYNCGKYYSNWKCPGNMPKNIDYQKMVSEYENGAFIYIKMPFEDRNYAEVRNESSILLHKALLEMEQYLWNRNEPLAISFIGGSCKLCKNGCGTDKCNNPYKARSPLEALGVNVVKSAEMYGIEVTFPPKEYIMRLGMIMW